MDILCTASSELALQDAHISMQRHNIPFDGSRQTLATRWIDIRVTLNLMCNNDEVILSPSEIAIWENSLTPMCGICSFCKFLLQGLCRALMLQVSALMRNKETLSLSEKCMVKVKVKLDNVEYLTDASKWVRGLQPVRIRDLFLVVLNGSAIIELGGIVLNSLSIEVPFEVFSEELDPVTKHLNIHRRPLDERSLSAANVEKIKEWLNECDEEHEKCQESLLQSNDSTISLHPTRLIDVGDTSRPPKLVETSLFRNYGRNGEILARYIAFSYCWGSSGHSSSLLRTTRDSLASRLQSIPINTMPQAFRDAVAICRELQIPFLWIDSLCIIQDDIRDWEIESSKMANIFSNAYLTVIAAAGSSCNDSFLHREPNQAYCVFPFKSDKHPELDGYYRLRHRPGIKWWGSDKMAAISGCRWIERGWTFQEERLARRVLMFGVNKFFFDCRSFEMAEDTSMRRLRPPWLEVLNVSFNSPGQETEPAENEALWRYKRMLLEQWWTICNHYSRRELSFDADKLPALSGMASKIAKNIESKYLAGMWESHLKHDLFWQANDKVRKPAKYRAPSWSWAAVDVEVRWSTSSICENDNCKMYCIIEDAKTTVAGLDPFGAVTDGYITITGPLVEVQLSWALDGLSQKYPWRVCIDNQEIARADLDEAKLEPLAEVKESRSWALLFAKCARPMANPRGIILHKTGIRRDGLEEFQREGIFRIFPHIMPGTNNYTDFWDESPRTRIIIT